MAEIIHIADDLTGAADSAAACMAHGLTATVLLHSSQYCEAIWPISDVLSIDANTRCLSADQAADITDRVVCACQEHGTLGPGSLLFKKLDSTLRGHFAAEIAAVLRARHTMAPAREKSCVIMVPALPAQGRTTVGGRQLLHGRPVHEKDIPTLLVEAGLSCGMIDSATVRAESTALEQSMITVSHQANVLLCDAETDNDLRRIAEASMVLRGRAVWAGSAGLAAHLPHAAGIVANTRHAHRISLASGPTLFVVGSPTSVARRQASLLFALPDLTTLHLQPASLLGSSVDAKPIAEALQSNRDALLVFEENERCSEGDSNLLTRAVAQLVASVAPLLGALVATGGETARALLDAFGVRRLRLLGEVESGIPISVADAWTRPLPIITKAGGFGSPEALLHCRAFLQALDRSSTHIGPSPPVF